MDRTFHLSEDGKIIACKLGAERCKLKYPNGKKLHHGSRMFLTLIKDEGEQKVYNDDLPYMQHEHHSGTRKSLREIGNVGVTNKDMDRISQFLDTQISGYSSRNPDGIPTKKKSPKATAPTLPSAKELAATLRRPGYDYSNQELEYGTEYIEPKPKVSEESSVISKVKQTKQTTTGAEYFTKTTETAETPYYEVPSKPAVVSTPVTRKNSASDDLKPSKKLSDAQEAVDWTNTTNRYNKPAKAEPKKAVSTAEFARKEAKSTPHKSYDYTDKSTALVDEMRKKIGIIELINIHRQNYVEWAE